MASVTPPRGRLPRRVYWVRRSVVVAVALLLVFGIGKLLGGNGTDSTGHAVIASTTAVQQSSGPSATLGPIAPSVSISAQGKGPLLPPAGECRAAEVSVLPSVSRAWAAQPIAITLQLTGTQPACTFKVSPESLVVKITSGSDRIWSSQDCPRAIPTTDVVVRSGTPADVPVTWGGRRSDAQCSNSTPWAMPGFYHLYAAALGSAPTEVQFEVTRAAPRLVTRAPNPRPSATASPAASTTKPKPAASAKPPAKPRSPASPAGSGKGSKCGGDSAAGTC